MAADREIRIGRRRARWLGAAVVAGVLAAPVAGCGDDDDAEGASGKDAFVAAADAICERIDAEGTELSNEVYGEDFSLDPTLDQQAELLRALVANVEEGQDEIAALGGPAEGQAILARVFGEDPFIEDARGAIALADAGDEAGFESALDALFGEGGDPDPELIEEAQAYGFRSCVPSDGDDPDDD
ncbi:MAG TPA: hypothetical protein VJ804_11270 [Acidimicrobiales bacterium]|nr:hypothetical protein [Acidimicrobiales bacterium]